MDRHDLERMFDSLTPDPRRERELLRQIFQDDARRKRTMKHWKRMALAVGAAALLVTAAAAAVVVSRLNQGFLDYLNVEPEDTEAVVQAENLLLPGAMELDITKEDNGAALHMSQVLRDRTAIMVLADFIAPEGTVLNMGEQDAPGLWMRKGFSLTSESTACFVDEAGNRMGDGLVSYYNWEVLEDDDPLDNHVSLMFTLSPQADDERTSLNAAALQIPANDLSYFVGDGFDSEAVYYGDWTVQIPLPQQDIGWTIQADQAVGELDGAAITAEELYLSPMTLELRMKREGGPRFDVPLDEEGEAAYSRWLSIGNNIQRLTLTTRDGETIPLELRSGGGGIGYDEKIVIHRLSKITDPAKFQGGTLTLEWDFYNSEERGSVTLSLDALTPVVLQS